MGLNEQAQQLHEAALQTAAFQRLNAKFGGVKARSVEKGLKSTDLTFGDALDIVLLYRSAIGESEGSLPQGLLGIMSQLDVVTREEQLEFDLARRLGSGPVRSIDLNRENALYGKPIDLEELDSENFGNGVELTHYPGGVMIAERMDFTSHKTRYEVVFPNRQSEDNGKAVDSIFSQTGLPFRSNIVQ